MRYRKKSTINLPKAFWGTLVGGLQKGSQGTWDARSTDENGVIKENIGNNILGGLVASAEASSSINNCYSTASVDGNSSLGSFVGVILDFNVTATNCFDSLSTHISIS